MLKFYYEPFSQPSRAVWMLLEATGVPYTPCYVDLVAGMFIYCDALIKSFIYVGDNMKEDFLKVSPTGKVPAINDDGFCLIESAAILKYIVTKYQLSNHWYPTADLCKRAKIDEYLSWHTENLRRGAGIYMFYKYFIKKVSFGIPPDENRAGSALQTLHKSVKIIESYYLKDTPFIHSQEITIADLQALCELTELWSVDGEIDPLRENPKLNEWLERCTKILNPAFDKVHAPLHEARENGFFKEKN
ncbi:PREDICTED: glutathione S-transferase T1-like isoform X1 [Amphimedon queenslandica]|uniref:Glutathione transferase n=1 Tax=Amphimedon queenslandica TaxID=400682 RepID=A0AAN0J0L0_AMPQE|nr:PREDICTED: glutathione S-transferase T1-like isoform X1 [Amphimedon queenslandica]|eukprot:XP_019850564.1 PREDICTED: glutathione S-transferase T1-like isoform X1 [Amphimedon queenslandica]